ncbi:MAG: hypothetical protein WAK41_16490 [Roseiarcus sp.]|uniref:hypothetical protein n=1 Tax=Roseiarcus sp. TaxID=1969460 RepID=UPI003BB1E8BA
MTGSIKVLRLRANESGLSSFDTIEIQRDMREFAPPAPLLCVSKLQPASGFVVLSLPVGWIGERHPSPARQILFCLAGKVLVTPGVGDAVIVGAGDARLLEDTSGSGHETESSRKNRSTRW